MTDSTKNALSTPQHAASFPAFPGEDFLAHAATQYREQAEARLATMGLLTVCDGMQPPAAKAIIDIDLSIYRSSIQRTESTIAGRQTG